MEQLEDGQRKGIESACPQGEPAPITGIRYPLLPPSDLDIIRSVRSAVNSFGPPLQTSAGSSVNRCPSRLGPGSAMPQPATRNLDTPEGADLDWGHQPW